MTRGAYATLPVAMRRLAPILVLALLSGCGDDPPTVITGDTVRLNVRAYRYDHQHVRAPAGELTFRVTNRGPQPTNFRVRPAGKEEEILSILTMEPGETGIATKRLRPGSYVMYSSVGRHETLGEYGTLEVTRG